ncbi:MAG: amidohydrolase [Actinomycetes bacterium]
MTVETTIVYPAKLVRTIDPACPEAEAVAVRGGRIRAVGPVNELRRYSGTVVDDRYADNVLVAGFIEAHSHAGSGGTWESIYVGRFDRVAPDGTRWDGCKTPGAVLDRLRSAERDMPADQAIPLLAWGFDPIYYPGQNVLARDLDSVSPTRPIHMNHASGHVCVVNSAVLRSCGIYGNTGVEGVETHADGTPTGELREFAAMALIKDVIGGGFGAPGESAIRAFGQDAVNNGVTTVTDLGSLALMTDSGVDSLLKVVDHAFPARLSVFHFGTGTAGMPPRDAAVRLQEVKGRSTGKLLMGHVKLMLDGSIQGFTARVQHPGYLHDRPNGIWNMSPAEFEDALAAYHQAGLLVHVHCNGDQATELFVTTLEKILRKYPQPDHRHTVTHSQMTTPAQYRRMAKLGMCANIFANHIWAWGDQHMDITLGPDRAARMNAAATALASGVPISLHSDTPVTPMAPLQTIKHAVTRLTPSGRVMGEFERISAAEALKAVTLGSAYMLRMDAEVGSIEPGKLADMAVLDADPLAVPVQEIDRIGVIGTVVGGEHFRAASARESKAA